MKKSLRFISLLIAVVFLISGAVMVVCHAEPEAGDQSQQGGSQQQGGDQSGQQQGGDQGQQGGDQGQQGGDQGQQGGDQSGQQQGGDQSGQQSGNDGYENQNNYDSGNDTNNYNEYANNNAGNDGYENISKNVIDGGFWFFDQIESNALYEVIDTVIYGEAMYSPLFLCVGNEPYNALPDDLKKIVDDSAQVFLDQIYPAVYAQEERVYKLLEEAGVEVIYTSDEDLEWLRAKAPEAWQDFYDTVAAAGYDGEAILAEFQGYIQKHNEEWADK